MDISEDGRVQSVRECKYKHYDPQGLLRHVKI